MGFHSTTQEISTIFKHLPQPPRSHIHHYQAHHRQMRFLSREIDQLEKTRLLRKTDEKINLFYNLRAEHHLETFTSASAFQHATLPSNRR